MGKLDGRICLITGAARGQGAAEAEIFAAEGGVVWLADVLDSEGKAAAKRIGGTYRHLDVSDEAGWAQLVRDRSGRVQACGLSGNRQGVR